MIIYLGQLNPTVGNMAENTTRILSCIEEARVKGADLAVFPETAISGYSPDDLLLEPGFVDAIHHSLEQIVKASSGIAVIVGCVRKSTKESGKPFRNSAAVIADAKLLGFQDKCLLPTYDVFDEWRYFEPEVSGKLWDIKGKQVAVTICEDIWPTFDPFCASRYEVDPLEQFKGKKLDLLVNISASPYHVGKIKLRKEAVRKVSKLLGAPVLVCNQVGAQDGLLFDGSSLYADDSGVIQAKSFQEESLIFSSNRQVDLTDEQELFSALTMGVRDYFQKQGFQTALLGLSGGIDSALVACIAVAALGKENILGVLLPSRFTSQESIDDATALALNLEIEIQELSIEEPFTAFLELLQTDAMTIVEENLQARIRADILMAIANREGSLLLNTGNKSELAMGYTTLYGDAAGSIAVIGDLLKSQVYQIAKTLPQIPSRILIKAPSAELRFDQKDSDTLPEYHILDPIVEDFVVKNLTAQDIAERHNLPLAQVQEIIRKIHQNEYKRRQCPFALRVSEKCFSAGRRVPIVHKFF